MTNFVSESPGKLGGDAGRKPWWVPCCRAEGWSLAPSVSLPGLAASRREWQAGKASGFSLRINLLFCPSQLSSWRVERAGVWQLQL